MIEIASEYIKQLEITNQHAHEAEKQLRLACHDIELSRREAERLKLENQALQEKLAKLERGAQEPSVGAPGPAPSAFSNRFHSQSGPSAPVSVPGMADLSRSLPPLNNGINASSSAMSMQGVQYSTPPPPPTGEPPIRRL